MVNEWGGNVDIDNVLYSLACTPCALSENISKIKATNGDPYPVCWKPLSLYFLFALIGGLGGMSCSVLLNLSPALAQGLTHSCIALNTGMYSGKFRSQLRQKYNIAESPFNDIFVHTFCSPCAIIQETAHIEHSIKTSEFDRFDPLNPKIQYMKL